MNRHVYSNMSTQLCFIFTILDVLTLLVLFSIINDFINLISSNKRNINFGKFYYQNMSTLPVRSIVKFSEWIKFSQCLDISNTHTPRTNSRTFNFTRQCFFVRTKSRSYRLASERDYKSTFKYPLIKPIN